MNVKLSFYKHFDETTLESINIGNACCQTHLCSKHNKIVVRLNDPITLRHQHPTQVFACARHSSPLNSMI